MHSAASFVNSRNNLLQYLKRLRVRIPAFVVRVPRRTQVEPIVIYVNKNRIESVLARIVKVCQNHLPVAKFLERLPPRKPMPIHISIEPVSLRLAIIGNLYRKLVPMRRQKALYIGVRIRLNGHRPTSSI